MLTTVAVRLLSKVLGLMLAAAASFLKLLLALGRARSCQASAAAETPRSFADVDPQCPFLSMTPEIRFGAPHNFPPIKGLGATQYESVGF